MEFRLLFEGRLPSNGSASQKHDIRKSFHPQLRELWRTNENLRQLAAVNSDIAADISSQERFDDGIVAMGRNWRRAGYNLVPLVTPNHALRCRLDIVLLRPEKQSGIVKHGDIDNKLKTLFDALRLPDSGAETGNASPGPDEDPLFVLLQDDILISQVRVTTDRLLMLPNARELRSDDAYAVIRVRLNHRDART